MFVTSLCCYSCCHSDIPSKHTLHYITLHYTGFLPSTTTGIAPTPLHSPHLTPIIHRHLLPHPNLLHSKETNMLASTHITDHPHSGIGLACMVYKPCQRPYYGAIDYPPPLQSIHVSISRRGGSVHATCLVIIVVPLIPIAQVGGGGCLVDGRQSMLGLG